MSWFLLRIDRYGDSDIDQQPVAPQDDDPLAELMSEVPSVSCGPNDDPSRALDVWALEEMASDESYVEPPPPIRLLRNESLSEDCTAYTHSHGFECVPYSQCDEDGLILTDGFGLIDIRCVRT